MNRFAPLFFLILFQISTRAQSFDVCMEVKASTGDYGIQGNRYMAWTVGEPFIFTLKGNNFTLTQGFHQPNPCGLVFLGNHDLADWGLSVFPNPTDGPLTVRYSTEKRGTLSLSVFDLLGQLVMSDLPLDTPEGTSIDTDAWPPGVYMLVIVDPQTKAAATMRVVRL